MDRPYLTPREIEVLNLVAEGMTSAEISAALGMAARTAETHRSNLLVKFGCHSVAPMVRHAIRVGLIEP